MIVSVSWQRVQRLMKLCPESTSMPNDSLVALKTILKSDKFVAYEFFEAGMFTRYLFYYF